MVVNGYGDGIFSQNDKGVISRSTGCVWLLTSDVNGWFGVWLLDGFDLVAGWFWVCLLASLVSD